VFHPCIWGGGDLREAGGHLDKKEKALPRRARKENGERREPLCQPREVTGSSGRSKTDGEQGNRQWPSATEIK